MPSTFPKFTFFTLLFAIGAICSPSFADEVPTLIWNSDSKNRDQTATAYENLYLELFNSGTLSTQVSSEAVAQDFQSELRQRGLYRGAFFSDTMNSLFCDLNDHICSRDRVELSPEEISQGTRHVGGYTVSTKDEVKWTYNPGSSNLRLVLPNYTFEEVVDLEELTVPGDWTLDELSSLDCRHWNVSCEEIVRALNPPSLLRPSNTETKSLILPHVNLEATLDVSNELEKYLSEAFQSTPGDLGSVAASHSQSLKRINTGKAPRIYEEINGAIGLGGGVWQQFSTDIETIMDEYSMAGEGEFQKPLWKLIGHPFLDDIILPTSLSEPINLLVIDNGVFFDHCDFSSEDQDPANCGIGEDKSFVIEDHGTHVYGLIFSQPNGAGVIGLNYKANPKTHVLRSSSKRLSNEDIKALRSAIFATMVDYGVVNFSWGYTPVADQEDVFENVFRFSQQRLLHVAAAGNHKKKFEQCITRPACGEPELNKISVVALNREDAKPQLWETMNGASNYGKLFDIAAIGENVLSTASDHKVGVLSGTSQAAAQVSAAASLVMSKLLTEWEADLNPDRSFPSLVKNRLIYTADIFPHLLNEVRSGRLNVQRALAFERSHFSFLKDGKSTTIAADAVRTLDKDGNDVELQIACERNGEELSYFKWNSILRMKYMESKNSYFIFRKTSDTGEYDRMQRIHDCVLKSTSAQILIESNGSEYSFSIGMLRDFVSRVF